MLTTLLERMPLVADFSPLLLAAHKGAEASVPTGKSDGLCWGIVLFCVILGLLVGLNPSKRTAEIKCAKEE